MYNPTQRNTAFGVLAVLLIVMFLSMDQLLVRMNDGFTVFEGLSSHGKEELPKVPEALEVSEVPEIPKIRDPLNGTNPRFYSSSGDILSGATNESRPASVKRVMGLVFFGRRHTVSILDCYLKRNLVKNGGMLDGVIWLERTTKHADLALLNKLIDSEPDYVRWKVDLDDGEGYASSYNQVEDDTLYIKMDDDIVYVEDTVIPSIIQTKLARPEYYLVSANIVNQPMISWIHWNLGAVKPYLPELDRTDLELSGTSNFDWRVSSLPTWEGPDDFNPDAIVAEAPQRWLPLRDRMHHILDNTPIERTEYDPFGRGWQQWQIGAQEHYSFLEHLENNELWRYKFYTWDFQYKRMGIQFIAIMGKDINAAKPIGKDDEHHLVVTMPRKLGRHAVADGRGIAAHYSFGIQDGMKATDILDRYRAFAEENICASPMMWQSEKDDDPADLEADELASLELESG